MRKKSILAMLLFVSTAISCSLLQTPFSDSQNTVKSKSVIVAVPKNVLHSVPDKHAAEENAIIVSLVDKEKVYVGTESHTGHDFSYKLKDLLEKHPAEKQMIYLKADYSNQYGDVVSALDRIRSIGVENVGLIVEPSAKSDTVYNVLKAKIPAEPQPDDTSELWKTHLFLNLKNDKKLNFARYTDVDFKHDKEEFNIEEIGQKLSVVFREREQKSVFRPGTNEIDKSIYIRAPHKATYAEVVRLADAAAGAGASPVYLQIDALDQ
jgi:biopolymer transport protein ExbD